MSYFIDICFICRENSNNLTLISSQDTNKIRFGDKLKYFLSEFEFKSRIPEYICAKCGFDLSKSYEFKQKCLQNITTYNKYAQQITTTDNSYKRPDFVFKTEISDENDFDLDIPESKSEIDVELVQNGDICLNCLKHSNNLLLMESQSIIEDKLKYFLPEYDFNSKHSKYICIKCSNKLSEMYEFKQKCLQNITTYEKNAQQITTTDSSSKSDFIRPELVYVKKEVLESQNEINVDVVNIEESIIKEERNEEASPQDIKEDFESGDQYLDFVCKEEIFDGNNHDTNIIESQTEINIVDHEEISIKEETNEKLILDDKLQSLLNEIKQENPEPDDKCCQNKNIIGENLLTRQQLNRPFTCKVCNKTFRHSRALSNHKIIHKDRKTYTCKICSKSFKQLRTLNEHNSMHVGEKPFTCEFCNKSFRLLRNLDHHKLQHSGKKPFICKICSKSFAQLDSLKKHKSVHTGKPFTCDICNKSFRHKSTLSTHKLLHNGENPFICEVCNESFPLLHTLKLHKLAHANKKPFTCEFCNKPFVQLKFLQRHKLMHTGEKPFICKICNKSFTRLSNLETHKILHTGEKPFICEICSKSFAQLPNLKRHKLVHTGEKPFTCEICNKSFRQMSSLTTHKLIHTGEKPFACGICDKSFRYSKALKKHKLVHTDGNL